MKTTLKTVSILVMVAALLVPVAVQAQTVTALEIKEGTVIYAHENQLLVEMSDGSARLVDVDPDFRFDVGGMKVANSELTPGTKLKALVMTTATPKVVEVTEVKEGTIVSIVGQTITIRTAEGVKMFRKVPSSLHFKVHGKMVPINKITEGMKITATYVVEEVEVDVEQDVMVEAEPPKH